MSSPIIITGGAQRLGRACALHLAKQGYPVVITYRSADHDLQALQQAGITCVQADFSDTHGIEAFIELIKQDFSCLRAIIHNASTWQSDEHAENRSEVFDAMFSVHAKAPYLMNFGLSELLLAQANQGKRADIIHLTDYVARKGSRKHLAYAASKAALDNLTLSFATHLAPLVKVNSIAPALLMFNEQDSEQYREKAKKKSLLPPAPGAEEGVKAVDYLLNSDYVTGQILALDGGRHLV